jgi:hypothetical protein
MTTDGCLVCGGALLLTSQETASSLSLMQGSGTYTLYNEQLKHNDAEKSTTIIIIIIIIIIHCAL